MNVQDSSLVPADVAYRRGAAKTWLKEKRWFILFVVVPTILATIYYGLIASDVYVSQSSFVIKSPEQKRSSTTSLANLIQTTGLSGSQEQTNEVIAYVQSRDALKALEKSVDIRSIYASPAADWINRFPRPLTGGSFEDLYKFYGRMTGASVNSADGMAVITTKAFTPEDAYRINRSLLLLSEGLVNRLNARVQTKGISEAEKQVELASGRALKARTALADYRNAKDLIDPEQQAAGTLDISNNLIAQRAALQAQLDQMRRVAPRNPSIPALRNRIKAVSAQIGAQEGKVVGTRSGIASNLGEYQNLLAEQKFAEESLAAANAALVQARADALRQQYYLEKVVDPNLPDSPLLPRRLLGILVVAAAALFLYFVGWMFVVGILEHAPED